MLYIEHEAGGIQLDSDATARVFDGVPDARKYVMRADSARPETIAEMKKRGFRCESAPKWSGSVEDGIQHLRSYATIVIHPRCKRTIEEARLWRYKTDARTDEVLPVLKDGNDHCWDAIRYALSPLIKKGPSVFVV
jgi:phage terminase large subunit